MTQTRPEEIRRASPEKSDSLTSFLSLVGATVYLALSARPPGSPTDIRRTLRSPLVEVCARCVRHLRSGTAVTTRRGHKRASRSRGHPLVSPAQPASPDQVKANEWRRTRAAALAATKSQGVVRNGRNGTWPFRSRAACCRALAALNAVRLLSRAWSPQRMNAPQQRCGGQICCEDRVSYLCRLHPCVVLAASSTPFMKCQ